MSLLSHGELNGARLVLCTTGHCMQACDRSIVLARAGVAWLILEGHHGAALAALAVAGASDWADGYVAKRWGQASVVGSYLDPAADKVLVGCTVAALAYEVSLPRTPLGCFSLHKLHICTGVFPGMLSLDS